MKFKVKYNFQNTIKIWITDELLGIKNIYTLKIISVDWSKYWHTAITITFTCPVVINFN